MEWDGHVVGIRAAVVSKGRIRTVSGWRMRLVGWMRHVCRDVRAAVMRQREG